MTRKNLNDCPVSLNFYGGCLRAYRGQWQAHQAPKAILNMISGMRLPFTSRPVLVPPTQVNLHRFSTRESPEMTEQIETLVKQQVLEKLSPDQLGMSFFSTMILCRKNRRRKKQTYFQPQAPQRVHHTQEISTDISFSNTEVSSEPRLAGKNRPLISLFSCTNYRVPSPVSAPDVPEFYGSDSSGLSDDQPSLRAIVCTKEFCNDNQLGGTSTPEKRFESFGLSRRFFTGQPVEYTLRTGSECRRTAATESGLDHQSREICIETYSGTGVSRYRLEHPQQPQNPSSEQGRVNSSLDRQHQQKGHRVLEGMPTITRHSELRQFFNPRGKTTLSTSAEILPDAESVSRSAESHITRSKVGLKLVAFDRRTGSDEQPLARESCSTLSDNGRCRLRLGSSTGRLYSSRQVESKSVELALQPERDVCNNIGDKTLRRSFKGTPRHYSIGQSNSGGLCSKRRGNTLRTFTGTDTPAVSTAKPMENNSHSGISTGKVQPNCRQSVTRQDISRMAPIARSNESNFPEARNAGNRSLCVKEHQGCAEICVERLERLIGSILQRFQQRLDVPTGLAVSTSVNNTKSTTSSEHSTRYVSSGSTPVEASVLATRPSPESPRPTNEGEESSSRANRSDYGAASSSGTRNETFSMENWGWADAITGWTEAEKSLLKRSWRDSTLKTYRPAWLRWIKWCENSNFDHKHPDGNSLSKYLAYLHLCEKMSYSTILLHKSVILTLGRPNNDLNSNFLVKHMLKSISLEKPKPEKAPIWDPSDLIAWLSTNPPARLNLFEASRRLACILLLASGRRVHDLTLLRVSPEYFIDMGDHIILWPVFGSKTDTASYRQSGWKLKINSNHCICPVFWIRKVLELGEQRRSAECNNALFISVTGGEKAATRTLIANWIKTVFRDAGIKASPGSVRSAVASLNWWENLPLDDILSRGNWRSGNTFAKFYCRQIKSGPDAASRRNVLIDNFQPI